MAFVTCDGREYTIALTAEYWVHVDGDDLDAEDVAWDVLEKALRKSDANEYEIYAVELVENISMPANVQLVGTSQTDFIKVGEPVLIVHGENV